MTTNRTSYVFVGLAGETAPGRPTKSGLYRMAVGDDTWALATRGLPDAPTIRAIATHPEHPEIVFAGTQNGPYRSTDAGEHWERVDIADHGLPVWSLVFDPRDSKVLYAGYENCEIFRSDDGGEHWDQLPVTVRFPEVTVSPGSNPAKRVLELAVNPANSSEIYGAIEVGGVIRSLDGGEHWENMSHGQYVNDDTVDMHGVLVARWRPGTVFAICSAARTRAPTGPAPGSRPSIPKARRTAATSARSQAIRRPSGWRRARTSRATSARSSAARTAAPAGIAWTWA